ncbi:MAG: S-layer homology domain-containing protein [Scytonema sp. PMC 1069.18]|nr:S-layer homology domain-containing protein [Scytonema sp. PMC 1069.18]MEC4884837.1 S-layer homology domain-containing protein [Scytonema sp. PMC 1070.18]
MLYPTRPVVLISLAVLLTSLTACGNGLSTRKLEESLAADPRLKDNPVTFNAKDVNNNQQQQPSQATVQLPADYPKDIPLYPNAKLQEVTPSSEDSGVSTRWLSSDPSNIIASYYQQQLQKNNWEVLPQSNDQEGVLAARRNQEVLKVSIQPQTVTNTTPNQPQTASEILLDYQPNSTETAQANPTPSPQSTGDAVSEPGESQFIGPVRSQSSQTQPTSTPNTTVTASPQEFSDLNKAPQELQKYIRDLAALGVLQAEPNTTKSNSGTTTNQFNPNQTITRRVYARWLIAANNTLYANDPTKQIRLASQGSQPVFQDVPKTDPDFQEIQGLAEAGLIPSPLSGDSTAVLFRPDAPLIREQMVLWKVPLDTRQALPNANLETVKQTWGFQDAGKIDPKALRAVLADFQNSEKSNIRRVFGYTTLFQPKKPATRAEAAASLWYFGTQGEGISAAEVSKVQRSAITR